VWNIICRWLACQVSSAIPDGHHKAIIRIFFLNNYNLVCYTFTIKVLSCNVIADFHAMYIYYVNFNTASKNDCMKFGHLQKSTINFRERSNIFSLSTEIWYQLRKSPYIISFETFDSKLFLPLYLTSVHPNCKIFFSTINIFVTWRSTILYCYRATWQLSTYMYF